MSDIITIRELGTSLFEIVPPTADAAQAVATLVGEDGAEALRRQMFSTFDEAVGSAVAYAARFGWRIHDQTGRLSDDKLAMAVKMYPAARDEDRL